MLLLLIVLCVSSCAQGMDDLKAKVSKTIGTAGARISTLIKSVPHMQDPVPMQEAEAVAQMPQQAEYKQQEPLCLELATSKPALFSIQNRSDVHVDVNAILTDWVDPAYRDDVIRYKPKRYGLQPGSNFMILSPDPEKTQFDKVLVHCLHKGKHIATYTFKDAVYIRLVVLNHPTLKDQLIIQKRME